MNNQQLQVAIDHARQFLIQGADGKLSGAGTGAMKNTAQQLEALERIQVARAGMIFTTTTKEPHVL